MVVGRSQFASVLETLSHSKIISLDTETTGLRPYHGHKLFSIILASNADTAFYFNFKTYPDLPEELLLTEEHLARLQSHLFDDPTRLWFIHRAKYDMGILAQDGLSLAGTVHCTMAQGRIEYNEQFSFDLDKQLKRAGAAPKSDKVEEWIKANAAWTTRQVPGRQEVLKEKHFDRVPFDIIVPYALHDAKSGYFLGQYQIKSIKDQGVKWGYGESACPARVMENERRLTKTVFAMERKGILIDLRFAERAAAHEEARMKKALLVLNEAAAPKYTASWQCHAELFKSEKDKWVYNPPTKTGQVNPSFESDVLKNFTNPLAKEILELRDATSKYQFYTGFSFHADEHGRVHPNFNQHGAGHGRFSSSEPNFQNLTSEEDEQLLEEFVVRRAIIPTPGFFLCAIDYSTMEYRFMLEYACNFAGRLTPLARQILDGVDFHQATADLATAKSGFTVTRGQAKTSNFLTLYGGGNQKLADQLGIPLEKAAAIRSAIRDAAPEIGILTRAMMHTAETRGHVRNWMGRICYFPDTRFAYRAPNYIIAGGCADVVKLAMNEIHDFLKPYKSRMVLTVHDELVFEIHESEAHLIPELKRIMEQAYPSKWLPLLCSAYTSRKSLADLEEWKAA